MFVLALLLTALQAALISPIVASCGDRSECILAPAHDSPHGTVPVPTFSYDTITGPLNWHNLSEANFLCANGTHQSPILINTTFPTVPEGSVSLHIPFAREAVMENLGTTVEVIMPDGTLTAACQAWRLKQFHFHTPSEHRYNDGHFEAEMHFVFNATDGTGKTAVLGFFIEVDSIESTPVLDHIFSSLNAIQTPGTATRIFNVDFSDFEAKANAVKYFHYNGSLTTPPCSEGVLWFIAAATVPLRVKPYIDLKHTTKTNNRYIQNSLGQKNLLQVAAASLPS